MDPSLEVQITRKMYGGAVVAGICLWLLLELVLFIFAGSQILPLAFVAMMIVVALLLRRWIYGEYGKQYPDQYE